MGQSVRYAGAMAIDVPVLELKNDPARVISLVVDAGRDLIARREADVLVLGCMSLSFLGVAEQARERIGMPVINPAMCALKTAEALVAQQLKPSRRTYAGRARTSSLWRRRNEQRNHSQSSSSQTALWGGVSALVAPRELGAWQVSGAAARRRDRERPRHRRHGPRGLRRGSRDPRRRHRRHRRRFPTAPRGK